MRPHMSDRFSGSTEQAVSEREQARRVLEARRKFRGDAVGYVAVNLFLIIVWLLTGHGYFWPAWVLAGWGVFLALDGWNAYFRRPINEDDIEAEMRRNQRGPTNPGT
jgi:2TM domain-containing protein